MAGGIFVHLVINRFGICGAAIGEAYDLSVRFPQQKHSGNAAMRALKIPLLRLPPPGKQIASTSVTTAKVRRADWANCVCHKIFLL